MQLPGGGQLGAEETAAELLEPCHVPGRVEAMVGRPAVGGGRRRPVSSRRRRTSKAVSSAELTSTTSRPITSEITRAR